MYRKTQPIPTLKQDKIPSRFIVFDTESYQGQRIEETEYQSFRLAVARFIELDKNLKVIKDVTYNSTDALSLADWIDKQALKDKALYVYAHNLKYDLQLSGLFTILLDMGYEPSLFVMEDPPSFIRLKKGRHSIMFVDTFNYWQFSVEVMGAQLGYEKLVMPDWSANDAEWFTYCERDVNVLTRYILDFLHYLTDNNLAPLGLTVASQAFRSYRKRFMNKDIYIHNKKPIIDLERAGYSGGRVEAFFIGQAPDQPYYKLDVNSMYPYVMFENRYPYEVAGYGKDLPIDKLAPVLEHFYCIADVSLITDNPAYPSKINHKLVFGVGNIRTVLHQPELELALSEGSIVAIHEIAVYKKAYIFREYVKFFYNLKQEATKEGNKVTRQLSKLFLNSLYGKFGQRGIKSQIVDNDTGQRYGRFTGYSHRLGTHFEINCLGDKMEVRYPDGESAYSFPAIAGAVTAYARIYLWELVTQAGIENTLYCDTDSLFTNFSGYMNVIDTLHDTRLGALKLEGQTRNLQIFGLKDYHFGDSVKHKGVPKKAKVTGVDSWEYEQFLGAKTWINEGFKPGVRIETREKRRRNVYDKGLLLTSGRVIPLTLSDW